jgi:hypothetical protein
VRRSPRSVSSDVPELQPVGREEPHHLVFWESVRV